MSETWQTRAQRIGADIAANAARHDTEDTFVFEAYRQLKGEGFFKALVPSEHGGYGVGYADMCAAIRALGAGCGSTALAFSIPQKVLKRVAGEDPILVSSGGSDWLKSAGQALKIDGGYRITARKIFSRRPCSWRTPRSQGAGRRASGIRCFTQSA